MSDKFIKPSLQKWMNPVDWFNRHGDFTFIFSDDKYDIIDHETARNIKTDQVYKLIDNMVQNGTATYSKFEMLTQAKFKNQQKDAQNYVEYKILKKQIPYIRVGTDYYMVCYKTNRYGVKTKFLKTWKKDTIVQDHKKEFLDEIPTFHDFAIIPDNINYIEFRDNYYNLYSQFPHKQSEGSHTTEDFPYISKLMNHIFGEQIELGYKYMKIIYQHPTQMLPILVLVSEERSTGKTTFLNLMDIIFGGNYVMIRPEDITNNFNAIYATANIIGIDETVIEKQTAVEKLKSIATQKTMTVNSKFVSQYTVDFFGKLILCTNKEADFIRIDKAEIRFWVRKINSLTELITDIENKMIKEIPFFLKYLFDLPDVDFSRSRMVFTDEEIQTTSLNVVKDESRSGLHKELEMIIIDHFNNHKDDIFKATAIDIKKEFFLHDNQKSYNYIHKVLSHEMGMKQEEKVIRYDHFRTKDIKIGKPFSFTKSDFIPKNDDFVNEMGDFVNEIVPF